MNGISILLDRDKIRTDGGTQARTEINEATVREYAETLRQAAVEELPWPFPDVIVFYDGENHWLGDGFHRVNAAKQAEYHQVSAEVRQGTRRDAVLFAVGANATHGLRRSQADKRRAIETLLRDDEWGRWSDREIARRCNVSHPTVAAIRAEVTGNFSSERVYVDKHGNETRMETASIGNSKWQVNTGEKKQRLANDWLRNYQGADGRHWYDLTDTQTWHANSPCAQRAVAEGIGIAYLRIAREMLLEEQHKAEQAKRQDADGRLPPHACPRCRAERTQILMGMNHWRCKNCGREFDSSGKIPQGQPEPDGYEMDGIIAIDREPPVTTDVVPPVKGLPKDYSVKPLIECFADEEVNPEINSDGIYKVQVGILVGYVRSWVVQERGGRWEVLNEIASQQGDDIEALRCWLPVANKHYYVSDLVEACRIVASQHAESKIADDDDENKIKKLMNECYHLAADLRQRNTAKAFCIMKVMLAGNTLLDAVNAYKSA